MAKGEVKIYFCLNGLFNGEEGIRCTTVRGQQADGWYYICDGDDDGQGPFKSRDEVVRLTKPVKVLGHTFLPFNKYDWSGLAGAEEGSKICHIDDIILIWDEKNKILSEIYDQSSYQRDWTFNEVM